MFPYFAKLGPTLLSGYYYTNWKKTTKKQKTDDDEKELTQSASYRAVLDHQPV